MSGFGSNGASAIIGHKKVATKLKRDNPKIISICCHDYRLVLAILPFFIGSTFVIIINNNKIIII